MKRAKIVISGIGVTTGIVTPTDIFSTEEVSCISEFSEPSSFLSLNDDFDSEVYEDYSQLETSYEFKEFIKPEPKKKSTPAPKQEPKPKPTVKVRYKTETTFVFHGWRDRRGQHINTFWKVRLPGGENVLIANIEDTDVLLTKLSNNDSMKLDCDQWGDDYLCWNPTKNKSIRFTHHGFVFL